MSPSLIGIFIIRYICTLSLIMLEIIITYRISRNLFMAGSKCHLKLSTKYSAKGACPHPLSSSCRSPIAKRFIIWKLEKIDFPALKFKVFQCFQNSFMINFSRYSHQSKVSKGSGGKILLTSSYKPRSDKKVLVLNDQKGWGGGMRPLHCISSIPNYIYMYIYVYI